MPNLLLCPDPIHLPEAVNWLKCTFKVKKYLAGLHANFAKCIQLVMRLGVSGDTRQKWHARTEGIGSHSKYLEPAGGWTELGLTGPGKSKKTGKSFCPLNLKCMLKKATTDQNDRNWSTYCFSIVSDKTHCRGRYAQTAVSCWGTAAAPKWLIPVSHDATAHSREFICAAYWTVLSINV